MEEEVPKNTNNTGGYSETKFNNSEIDYSESESYDDYLDDVIVSTVCTSPTEEIEIVKEKNNVHQSTPKSVHLDSFSTPKTVKKVVKNNNVHVNQGQFGISSGLEMFVKPGSNNEQSTIGKLILQRKPTLTDLPMSSPDNK